MKDDTRGGAGGKALAPRRLVRLGTRADGTSRKAGCTSKAPQLVFFSPFLLLSFFLIFFLFTSFHSLRLVACVGASRFCSCRRNLNRAHPLRRAFLDLKAGEDRIPVLRLQDREGRTRAYGRAAFFSVLCYHLMRSMSGSCRQTLSLTSHLPLLFSLDSPVLPLARPLSICAESF